MKKNIFILWFNKWSNKRIKKTKVLVIYFNQRAVIDLEILILKKFKIDQQIIDNSFNKFF